MKIPIIVRLAACLGVAATLASCTAREIRDLNGDLTAAHAEKIGLRHHIEVAQKPKGTTPAELDSAVDAGAQLIAVEHQLAEIARQAEAAAGRAADRRTAISLYRIAATAAWQAAPPTRGHSVTLSAAGMSKCGDNTKAGGWAESPRDCAMLYVIPELVSNDEQVEIFRSTKASNLIEATGEQGDKARTDVRSAFNDLLRARSSIATKTTDLPPQVSLEFKEALRARQTRIACNAYRVYVYYSTSRTGDAAGATDMQRQLEGIKVIKIVNNKVTLLEPTCAVVT